MGVPRRCALVLWLAVPPASAAAGTPELQAYMKKAGFSDGEIASVERGAVVSRGLPQREDNDVFVAGVVRIAARPETLVEELQRIDTFRNRPPVLQIGRFGTPPKVEDLERLTFEPKDLEALRSCKVGDCDLKIGAAAMELARRVDWKAKDADAQASRLLKEILVAQVRSYLEDGASAMAVYNDNETPESTAVEVAKILGNDPNLLQFNPEFLRYVLEFPRTPLPDVDNLVYWSKEKTRKAVVSVAHVSIQRIPVGAATGYSVAMKHIYDSHYFLANMEFLTLLPEDAPKPGFTLVHVLRARIDPPHSFRGMVLGKMREGMRDALDRDLDVVRKRLEAGEP